MKKILLFLSERKDNTSICTYICPDGSSVQGEQTNDAPVKYLLHRYPKIGEILCIVTPATKESGWERFQLMVRAENPRVKCILLPFDEREGDFEQGLLPQVLRNVQSRDEIYLETTGGMRNAVMYLLLISRALSYVGAVTAGAVYSNYSLKKVEDISEMVGLFDLIGGMQELVSFGNVKNLRRYYEKRWESGEIDFGIAALLDAVEALWGSITLCRAREIHGHMDDFNRAVREADHCGDPLMRALLPAFREKFGNELTTPGLIHWCIESDMLQQALTVYNEQIPDWLFDGQNGVLSMKAKTKNVKKFADYRTENAIRFQDRFLTMSWVRHQNELKKLQEEKKSWRNLANLYTLQEMDSLIYQSEFYVNCTIGHMKRVSMDYLYIHMLRNMTNHANETSTEDGSKLTDYLYSYGGYPKLSEVTAQKIKEILLDALGHLTEAQCTR